MKAINRAMKLIRDKGLKPARVEQDLGLSNGYFATMEKRQGNIGGDIAPKIAEYLDISLNFLLTGEEGIVEEQRSDYLVERRKLKQNKNTIQNKNQLEDVPIYNIPIDASFLERYREDNDQYEPIGYLKIPKLRNCDFAAIVSGNSMYPLMKSGSIAVCRIIKDFQYFDEGEMYLISTTNGFETVKYVQSGDNDDELKLIPHNEKIKPSVIKKSIVIRMCLVEAWLNFR
ncbi:MAG: hypothetical protein C0459_03230 [Chitinophaga sp.]|jgi:phage repressor protein C with HTH and peptisase S24 domain|nr:hypothetical protein [Chitinophaga sp.]